MDLIHVTLVGSPSRVSYPPFSVFIDSCSQYAMPECIPVSKEKSLALIV